MVRLSFLGVGIEAEGWRDAGSLVSTWMSFSKKFW